MKLRSFFTTKEMITRLKRQPTENLWQLYIWQGINNQNILGAQKTSHTKNQQLIE
jgi:hypothetical protein